MGAPSLRVRLVLIGLLSFSCQMKQGAARRRVRLGHLAKRVRVAAKEPDHDPDHHADLRRPYCFAVSWSQLAGDPVPAGKPVVAG